jgi:hypothetical protein
MSGHNNIPICKPSYIFFSSARTLDSSSLLAELCARAFKSFSTASIRRTCADTWRRNTQIKENISLGTNSQTFSVLACSSSTLACSAAEASLYSSKRWYAANAEAMEKPNRNPIILRVTRRKSEIVREEACSVLTLPGSPRSVSSAAALTLGWVK